MLQGLQSHIHKPSLAHFQKGLLGYDYVDSVANNGKSPVTVTSQGFQGLVQRLFYAPEKFKEYFSLNFQHVNFE